MKMDENGWKWLIKYKNKIKILLKKYLSNDGMKQYSKKKTKIHRFDFSYKLLIKWRYLELLLKKKK